MSERCKQAAVDYLPVFRELEDRLKEADWFTSQWATRVGEFPGGIGLQLFKENWHNAAGNGIHFEIWLNQAELKRQTVPLVLHVETAYPGKKKAFLQQLLERGGDLLRSWDGYTISTTNSMQPFIRRLPLGEDGLVSRLVDEFARLQALVPVIDQIIEEAPR